MENIPSDWHNLKNIAKVNKIAAGVDSHVYKVDLKKSRKNTVAKNYINLGEDFDPEIIENILQNYYSDTERAQKLLEGNLNPLNQKINIDGVEYVFNYEIVPQGGILLEGNVDKDGVDSILKDDIGKNPINLSQSFMKGANLLELTFADIASSKLSEEQKIFQGNSSINNEIQENVAKFTNNFINKKLKVFFRSSSVNVKPFLDKENRILKIVITDLAASLRQYYLKSEKYKTSQEAQKIKN